MVKLIKAAHNLDIKTFSSFFPAPGESSFEVEWGFIHNSKKISLKELQTRLEYVLSDPPPQCLGVKRQGRVFLYPSVYFKNFGYLHELKQPQASGISRVRFLSNHMENRNTIIIEEIPKSEIEQELSGLEPCTGLTTGVRSVMDEPEISQEVLDLGTSVAKERIVFEAPAEEGGITLFISNLDGTNRKQILPAKEGDYNRAPKLFGGKIVYEADRNGKWSLNIYDTKTQIEEVITQGYETISACPSEHPEGGIVYTSQDVDNGAKIIRKFGNNVETIIPANPNIIGCPIMSNDGEFVVFSTKQGLTISYKKDNFQKSTILVRGSVTPLDVSKKDNAILYMSPSKYSAEPDNSLNIFDLQSGKILEVARKVAGGSFNKLGNLITYPAITPQGGYEQFLYSREHKSSTKLFYTPDSIWHPVWEKEQIFVAERKSLVIIPGLIHSQKNGQLQGHLTDYVFNRLIDEKRFKINDFIVPNLAEGGRFSPNGFYLPADQSCDVTLRGQYENGEGVAKFLEDFVERRPKDEIIITTHSLGSTYGLTGLEILLEKNPNFPFSRIKKVIVTHGPNLGIKKDLIELLSRLWYRSALPQDCGWVLGIPHPSVFQRYKAIKELREMWNNKDATVRRWGKLVVALKDRGVEFETLASENDCVMDETMCNLDEHNFENRLLNYPNEVTIYTQTLPGANNIIKRLGHSGILGHDTYWWTKAGSDILVGLIGDQLTNDPRS